MNVGYVVRELYHQKRRTLTAILGLSILYPLELWGKGLCGWPIMAREDTDEQERSNGCARFVTGG